LGRRRKYGKKSLYLRATEPVRTRKGPCGEKILHVEKRVDTIKENTKISSVREQQGKDSGGIGGSQHNVPKKNYKRS